MPIDLWGNSLLIYVGVVAGRTVVLTPREPGVPPEAMGLPSRRPAVPPQPGACGEADEAISQIPAGTMRAPRSCAPS